MADIAKHDRKKEWEEDHRKSARVDLTIPATSPSCEGAGSHGARGGVRARGPMGARGGAAAVPWDTISVYQRLEARRKS